MVGRRARGPMKPFLQKKYSAKDHAHHMPHSFFSFLRGLMGKNWLHIFFASSNFEICKSFVFVILKFCERLEQEIFSINLAYWK